MVARADAVLAAIPLLVASGLVLGTAVTVSGVGTTALAVVLTPAGAVAAFALILREMFFGPVARRTEE